MYSLLRRFAERGIAAASTPEGIQLLKASPLSFAKHSLTNWVNREGGDQIENQIDYYLSIDAGYSVDLEHEKKNGETVSPLVITVGCGGCGFLAVAPVLRKLEAREKGLARAWYNAVVYGCCRWMRVYDFDAARDYVFGEKERMDEEEDPEERAQYEIPDVESDIPVYLRKSKRVPVSARDLAMLRRHANSRTVGSWVRHALEIHRLSNIPMENDCREVVDSYYDSSPVPCLLVVMTPNDTINGCFDIEGEYMNQSSPSPTFAVAFDPADNEETDAAFRSLTTFIHLNRELCQLIAEVRPLTEKDHANDR
jgi:hypothetical protein